MSPDHTNCFFDDPDVNWAAGLSTDASGVVTFDSQTHRKIRLYREQVCVVHGNSSIFSLWTQVFACIQLLTSVFPSLDCFA